MQEMQVQSLGWEDSLEEEMAPHSSILAWGIPWTKKPGLLQVMGSQEEHSLATKQQQQAMRYPGFFQVIIDAVFLLARCIPDSTSQNTTGRIVGCF